MRTAATWLVPALIALIAGVVVGFNVGQRMHSPAPMQERAKPRTTAVAQACPEAPPQGPAPQARERLAALERSLSECRAAAAPGSDAVAPVSTPVKTASAAGLSAEPIPTGAVALARPSISSLPESFRRVLETDQPAPKMSELNARFEQEDQDASWAPGMEDQLQRFLLSHEQAPVVQVGAVECRTSLCRIWGTQYAGEDTWMAVLADMQTQTWWAFTGNSSATRAGEEGRSLFLTILTRVPPGAPGDLP